MLDPIINGIIKSLGPESIKRIEDGGTVVQVLVPYSTAFYSLWRQDYEGLAYIGSAFILNQLTIEVFKRIIPEMRPTGHPYSFPSGHTMATAFGAMSLIKRYGIKNIPAFFVITSCGSVVGVGFSRVVARAHWVHDVVAGALLGSLIGYLVPPLNEVS